MLNNLMAARRQNQDDKKVEATQLLAPLVMLLRQSGISDLTLNGCFAAAIARARRLPTRIRVQRMGSYYHRGAITDLWLRHPSYTNAAGKPLDLPLRGKISLTSLTKSAGTAEPPGAILKMLLRFGTVKRTQKGKFRLVKRFMNYKAPGVLPFEPNHQFLVDAISAATRGMGSQKGNQSLFWLNAEHRCIPKGYASEFLKYVQSRGVVFLHEINDWLDQHAIAGLPSARSRRRLRRVGVGLFPISTE